MDILEAIKENLIQGQAPKVKELIQQALAEGISPNKILDDGLIGAMSIVGEGFQKKEMYVPEVLLAARAMLSGMEVLEPILASAGVERKGKVVLGTVQGDIHSMGKNLVGIMLRGAGFEVNDLGVDIPPEKFVDAAKEGTQMVCLSCLLTTSLPFMQSTLEALAAAGLRDKIKTMVGGPLVTQGYADKIGADGYAPNAAAAVDKAKELLGVS